MNLKSIFKYRVPILVFFLAVSYSLNQIKELSNWQLLLDEVVIAVFLILAIYAGRKVLNQSFIKMLLSNFGFILGSILVAAVVNLLLIEGLDYSFKSVADNIAAGLPRVISKMVIDFVGLMMLGTISSILIFLLVRKGESKANTLDEDLL